MRVSAILVAYNQAPQLRRAIAALEKSKDRERLEIVVVDCGSSDESARIDAEFPSIDMLRLPHHLGATRAMNIASRTAKADLLLYLSPDVEVNPETVGALAGALDADATVASVSPMLVDTGGKPVPQVRKLPVKDTLLAADFPAGTPDASQETIAVEYPSLDALMIRKTFLKGMNYFDERFGHYWADADLAMQIRRASRKALIIPKITASISKTPDPLAEDSLAQVDRISGAAEFLGKYGGGGFGLRIGAALRALGRFDFGALTGVLSGSKLDGSQAR